MLKDTKEVLPIKYILKSGNKRHVYGSKIKYTVICVT